MRARVYVSIFGHSFSPQAFHAIATEVVGGNVGRRKRSGAPFHDHSLEYWASDEVESAAEEAVSVLSALLTRMNPLRDSPELQGADYVFAHIVWEYEDGDAPVGWYVPRQLIHQLEELRAELDIDVGRRPRL